MVVTASSEGIEMLYEYSGFQLVAAPNDIMRRQSIEGEGESLGSCRVGQVASRESAPSEEEDVGERERMRERRER